MLKNMKKIMMIAISLTMILGFSMTTLAAETLEDEQHVVIELFDFDSPYLIKVADGNEISRTTSRPTSVWNMATQGSYSYSAYSNNNTMWSKYIFFDPGNIGYFSITAKSTNTNYQMIFYDALYNRTFTYSVPSTNVTWRTKSFSSWKNADEFYFGVDTSRTGGSVSVNGVVSLE